MSDRRPDPLPLRCRLPWQADDPIRPPGQTPYRERRCPSPGAGRVDRPNDDEATYLILALKVAHLQARMLSQRAGWVMPMVSAKWNRQGGKRFGSPGRHDMRAVAMHAAVARWAPSSLIAYGISG